MMRLLLVALAFVLVLAALAISCGPAVLAVLTEPLPLAPFLAQIVPAAAMSVAALPLGALGAAGLAAAPPPLRLGAYGLLAMALLGIGLPPHHAAVAPLAASIAIVMLILTPGLSLLDPVLLDAAAASGASPWDRLVLIVLPRIAAPCMAAFLLCLVADAVFLPVPG